MLVRGEPGRASLASVLTETQRLVACRALGVRSGTFAGVSDKVVALRRARAEVETPSLLLAHPPAVRATMLAAWCWSRETEITDALIDVLLATVHRIFANATQRVQTAVTVEARRVDAKSEKVVPRRESVIGVPARDRGRRRVPGRR